MKGRCKGDEDRWSARSGGASGDEVELAMPLTVDRTLQKRTQTHERLLGGFLSALLTGLLVRMGELGSCAVPEVLVRGTNSRSQASEAAKYLRISAPSPCAHAAGCRTSDASARRWKPEKSCRDATSKLRFEASEPCTFLTEVATGSNS